MDSVDRSRDHRSSRRRSRSSKDRRRDERPDRDEEVKKGRVAEAVDRNPLDDRERDRRDRDLRKEGRSRSREGDGDRRRRRDRDSRSRERSPRRRRDDGRMLGSRERSSRHRRDEDQYRERSSDRRRSYRDSRDRRDREKTTDKDSPSPPPSRSVRSSNPLPDQNALRPGASAEGTPAVDDEPKEKPNFNASGLLAAESNTFQGVVLKYHEPPSAAKPTKKWRLYVFKPPASAPVEILSLHAQSAFLIGRDATICDIPLLHPSISKQHAVIQFKWRERVNEYGDRRRDVVPYVIDLESANGTSVNGEVVEGARYVELMVGDLVRFGESTREYVVMCE
ncbi:SMAD/FHA domain-containing protein, partial [Saitoella complicata NRRL Y-17804]|uniref:SMAD/FHA domain-containing protein n=1 Tax=Saitoella complicata (strain BCRC 22490 / CBS 7301 / JCM 7358 / NBRC 10748 / NRRL Y-17804) TaxID=698492 RepID=UPI0008682284